MLLGKLGLGQLLLTGRRGFYFRHGQDLGCNPFGLGRGLSFFALNLALCICLAAERVLLCRAADNCHQFFRIADNFCHDIFVLLR